MEVLLQSLANGITLGGLYALVAVGMTLIFGVMRIINLFHGELVMVGMFIAFALLEFLRIDPLMATPFVALAMFALGLLMYRCLLHPIRHQPHMNQAILTMGVSIVLFTSFQYAFTSNYRPVRTPSTDIIVNLGAITTNLHYLLSLVAILVITFLLYLLLMRTDVGRAIRASAADPNTALLMGIDVNMISMVTFGIGSAAAGAAASLLLPIYTLYPGVGVHFLGKSFTVVVLGGMGSVTGAVLGGVILGVVESMSSVYVSASVANMLGFVIFIAILLFRPAGILGRSLGRV